MKGAENPFYLVLNHMFHTTSFTQQVISNQGNTSSLWKTIRQALPKKSSQRPQYTRDTDVLANEFNRFFISVGQEAARKSTELANHYGLQYINPTSQVMPTSQSGEEGCFVFQPVTPDDVRTVIHTYIHTYIHT